MRFLILGSSGLIGYTLFKLLEKTDNEVFGTYNSNKLTHNKYKKKIIKFNALKKRNLIKIINNIRPNIVINCIGITKHIKLKKKSEIFKINSKFPHFAKRVSNKKLAKFIQISTDCVFDGKKGNYTEKSIPNADDIYGISKARGEIEDNKNLTIRTSTIGHEYFSKRGLLEWFLSQKVQCDGYSKAYFNGFPTYYFSKILLKIIKLNLSGIIHISGKKISKYSLIKIINYQYKKNIKIKKNTNFLINRTLNNNLLKKKVGNFDKNWEELISEMKNAR